MKRIVIAIFSLVFLAGPVADSRSSKISHQLQEALKKSPTAEALVFFGEEPGFTGAQSLPRVKRLQFVYESLKENAQATQASAVDLLEKKKIPFQAFHIVSAILLPSADLKILKELAKLPEVKRVELNAAYALKLPEPVASSNSEEMQPKGREEIAPNLVAIGADRVWNELGVRGEGIIIAGQDTGFAWRHPALINQYRGFMGLQANHNFNWHDAIHRTSNTGSCGANTIEPCDDSGHGTHTMGTMLGDDGGDNLIGVAPAAKWIACRNMDRGVGTPASYLECFEYFLAPYPLGGNSRTDARPELAPHIINNSWGCPTDEGCRGPEFVQAIRAMHAAGILVVVAAGNDGPGCGSVNAPPGNYSGEVVSVAALDHRNGNITDFSSRGPSNFNGGIGANIAAPGQLVRSSVPSGGYGPGGLYESKSGTSMASPHVAGAVALLWSARPELQGKIEETFRILEKSATPKTTSQTCGKFPGNQIPNAVFGYGALNVYNAIKFKE